MSRIITPPVHIVLSFDATSQMEQSFFNEKCKFWVKNTVLYCMETPVTRIPPSVVILASVSLTYVVLYGLG
jgi:hypothetical protein